MAKFHQSAGKDHVWKASGATIQGRREVEVGTLLLGIDKNNFFFLIRIHPMQGWTATTRQGVTRKKAQKRLQDTKNLFRKNLQLKDVC